MLFGAIADFLGYNSSECARVLASLPSILEYNSQEKTINFRHGRKLLDYMSNPRTSIYHINTQAYAIQMTIQMMSCTNSYKGNIIVLSKRI